MNGKGPIVLMLANHSFYEHPSTEQAHDEAKRLVLTHGGEAVVYVPVYRVRKTPPTQTVQLVEHVPDCHNETEYDDIPF